MRVVGAPVVDEDDRHHGRGRIVDVAAVGGVGAQVLLVRLHVARDLTERLRHDADFGTTDELRPSPAERHEPVDVGGRAELDVEALEPMAHVVGIFDGRSRRSWPRCRTRPAPSSSRSMW